MPGWPAPRGRGPSAEPTCGYPTPPRHIGASIVNISYATYNAAQRAACAKILRLLAKVATRDVRIVRWPSFETVATRAHLAWVGYDALRWCREDRARVVDFSITSGKMYGLAPLD